MADSPVPIRQTVVLRSVKKQRDLKVFSKLRERLKDRQEALRVYNQPGRAVSTSELDLTLTMEAVDIIAAILDR